jgi:hypothetical protein
MTTDTNITEGKRAELVWFYGLLRELDIKLDPGTAKTLYEEMVQHLSPEPVRTDRGALQNALDLLQQHVDGLRPGEAVRPQIGDA